MNYRVLVVEDEYWIRKSICNEIERVFGEKITVLESENGENALALLAHEKVSFVLTDINMPFMDGLALISHIKQQYQAIPVLVLSGYSDFPLVRKALTEGALDYLLKPVKEAELRAAVEKVEKEMIRQREVSENLLHQRLKSVIYEDYIKDFMLSTYICQKEAATSLYQRGDEKEYIHKIEFPLYMSVIQRKGINRDNVCGQSMMEKRYERKKKLRTCLGTDGIYIIENTYRFDEYILLCTEENIVSDFENIERQQKDSCTNSVIICGSLKVENEENISNAYKEIILKIISNARYRKGFQYISMDIKDIPSLTPHGFSEELENEVKQAFHHKDKNGLESILMDKLGIRRIEQERWRILEIKQTVSRFRSLIYAEYIRKIDMYELWEVDNLCDSIEMAITSGDTDEILELFHQVISSLIFEESEDFCQGKSISHIISQVMEYVEKHYNEDITLSFLAAKFYLTPSYLSRSFKKQTGKNLIAFITAKRLENAVSYIKSGKKSLTEIAFLTGYDDYTYFNKVFRRYIGVSPTQYREQCEKSKNNTSR